MVERRLTFSEYQNGTDETVAYADDEDLRDARIDDIGVVALTKLVLETVKLGRTADAFKKFIRDGTEPLGGVEGQGAGAFTLKFDHKQIYTFLGLLSEMGEVAEIYADATLTKSVDDHNVLLRRIMKELGDVEWYVARLAREFGIDLELVASHNLEKLRDRKARGKIGGSGDER